jgi:two-component system sensor histidine kinase PilS (NtrC family)
MLFRVVLVTIFLGTALLVDVGALADFSNSRSVVGIALIIGTYGLTILYALLLRAHAGLDELATLQICGDLVTVAVLVHAYGGIDSPFLFLFLLTVIGSAYTIDRRGALYTAAGVVALLGVLAARPLGLFSDEVAPGTQWRESLLRFASNGTASFVVALLAGYLTERLGEAATQIEEHQASLRELRALNENILASLSSGLLTIDQDERVIFFNQAAESITRLRTEQVLGRPLLDVLPGVGEKLDDAAESQRGETELELEGDGQIPLGFTTSPLLNAAGEVSGRIVIFQDLSDIKLLEAKVTRTQALAAIGSLSAAIAHEIRNPLAAISGSVEMLSADELPEDDQELLRIVLREVDRLNKLISDFLEYSRPRQAVLRPAEPSEAVARVLELFRNRLDAEVEVSLEEADMIDIDPEGFRQILWNLLNNAAEAAKSNDEPRVRLRLFADDSNHVRILVEDNGEGIDDEHLDRVFQPFFTTKAKGTGLGLATIFRLVEGHNAQVLVRPHGELGGATFELIFPPSSGDVPASVSLGELTSSYSIGGELDGTDNA